MPYNKGDFTQQGVNGDVSALVRLNEKRVMKVVLSSDDESDNCDISGKVYDLLNGTSYDIGSGVSGNIEITENGENINVAPYATATVNVSGGTLPTCSLKFINSSGFDLTNMIGYRELNTYFVSNKNIETFNDGDTLELESIYVENEEVYTAFTIVPPFSMAGTYTITPTNAVNCSYDNGEAVILITNIALNSSITLTITYQPN